MYMDADEHWDDDDRLYSSGRDSDDSPILSNRFEKFRRYEYATPRMEETNKRSTLTVLAKFYLFCTAMIMFCMLMYIPVYNTASDHLSKESLEGWSKHTNRDTKIYVQPNNVTILIEPRDTCRRHVKNKRFLLIVVCSSTTNFEHRLAIRETWGNYTKYLKMSKIYRAVRDRYRNYNFSYDLYTDTNELSHNRVRRDIRYISRLLPELTKVLQEKLVKDKTENVPETRFEDDDDSMLPEFDMNEVIGEQTYTPSYDYYDTNVMKIPPRGYEDKVLTMLREKLKENLHKNEEINLSNDDSNTVKDYKVVFLLGLPSNDNDSSIQNKILEESEKYGDIIQEGFIDTYNNLTLKSIMMLKWITNNCNDSVRYILKSDDDMYINVPNLIDNLRNKSREFDKRNRGKNERENMLIGKLICGARPLRDTKNKWYSPRYMYGGKFYPKYLSGTAYVLSADAAYPLYDAALRTNYFHLEDVFITGMCAARARPPVAPRGEPALASLSEPVLASRSEPALASFSDPAHVSRSEPPLASQRAPALAYLKSSRLSSVCSAVPRAATAHRVSPDGMRQLLAVLGDKDIVDTCERIRLTKVRRDRLKPKPTPKRLPRH